MYSASKHSCHDIPFSNRGMTDELTLPVMRFPVQDKSRPKDMGPLGLSRPARFHKYFAQLVCFCYARYRITLLNSHLIIRQCGGNHT